MPPSLYSFSPKDRTQLRTGEYVALHLVALILPPAIFLYCRIPGRQQQRDLRYSVLWTFCCGWLPGVLHAAVYLNDVYHAPLRPPRWFHADQSVEVFSKEHYASRTKSLVTAVGAGGTGRRASLITASPAASHQHADGRNERRCEICAAKCPLCRADAIANDRPHSALGAQPGRGLESSGNEATTSTCPPYPSSTVRRREKSSSQSSSHAHGRLPPSPQFSAAPSAPPHFQHAASQARPALPSLASLHTCASSASTVTTTATSADSNRTLRPHPVAQHRHTNTDENSVSYASSSGLPRQNPTSSNSTIARGPNDGSHANCDHEGGSQEDQARRLRPLQQSSPHQLHYPPHPAHASHHPPRPNQSDAQRQPRCDSASASRLEPRRSHQSRRSCQSHPSLRSQHSHTSHPSRNSRTPSPANSALGSHRRSNSKRRMFREAWEISDPSEEGNIVWLRGTGWAGRPGGC